MEELKHGDRKPHRVSLDGRERMTITGVEDMDSFNESEVIFLTNAGMITVTGDDLHINRLDLNDGTVIIDGMIGSLDYADHEEERLMKKGGILGKVFK